MNLTFPSSRKQKHILMNQTSIKMSELHLILSLGGNPKLDHHALYLLSPSSTPPTTTSNDAPSTSGTIANGMIYESRPQTQPPEEEPGFLSKQLLGKTKLNAKELDELCKSITPPEKQFDGFKRIDKTSKLRRCQEWSSEVVEMLKKRDLLEAVE